MPRNKSQPGTIPALANSSRTSTASRDAEKKQSEPRCESPSKTIIELEDSLNNLQKELDGYEARHASDGKIILDLRNRLDRRRQDAETLRGQNATLKKENANLKANEKSQNQEIEKLKRRDNLADGETKKLKKDCQGFKDDILKIRKENSHLKNEKELYERENSDLSKEKTTLKAEINRLKLSNRSLKVQNENAEAQLHNFEEQLRNQSSHLEHASGENAWLKGRLQDMDRKIARHDKEYESLVVQCSDLAREVSGLRKQYRIDDDSALKANLKGLHFEIRSWCSGFCDANTRQDAIVFAEFPSEPPGQSLKFWSNTHEVNILTSCIWEWILWLVLITDTTDDGCGDLWTDKETAQAVHKLENQLKGVGKTS